MTVKYVLGLDQGGSKTHAVVADMEGNILGIGCGAGACHSVIGLEAAAAAIYDASMQAISAAGIAVEQIDVVGAGLTGVDWPHETQLLTSAVSDTLHTEATAGLRITSRRRSNADRLPWYSRYF